MKITPIEIRQHTFEKKPLGGYRVDEVDAFLSSLSQEWERVTGENKMLKMQLELAEKELNKLKEIELTLFRTLKNAEDSSASIAEQANQQAEKYLAETRQKADEQITAAKRKAAVMVQDAENQTRYVRENLSSELKSLEQDFKAMERYKDNLMVQIRALATNAMESVDRFEKKFAKQSAKQKFDEVAAPEAQQAVETEPVQSVDMPAESTTADTAAEQMPVAENASVDNTATGLVDEAPAANEVVQHEDDFDQFDDDESQPLPTTASVLAANAVTLPADADVPTDLPTNEPVTDEPLALAGADAAVGAAPQPAETAHQEAIQEESNPKKGGSFFDQI
ncbi:DivIVA domain-containing protein [Fibrella aquatilis]|uniref:DivIVA domain-containing protein n=1 Tax=Fibrella aquatilis TaxID=2817059 RepID=A0A939G7J3_9BACT|nr:DivIVA domain-containing protein [Fibrella aquatilis]MBO0931607.1 DivIVA domain-containing protein [Fibrella aquatilis]